MILTQWHALFDDFNTSTKEFYDALEKALEERKVPDTEFKRVLMRERAFGSKRREYLRLDRDYLRVDVCAAPFGTGFFFSWRVLAIPFYASVLFVLILLSAGFLGWAGFSDAGYPLAARICLVASLGIFIVYGFKCLDKGALGLDEFLLKIPIVSMIYEKYFRSYTYYRLDQAIMYQETIQRAVNEIIDGLTEKAGIKGLSPEQKLPSLNNLQRRR